jgi:SAM-dependent methyltransferase
VSMVRPHLGMEEMEKLLPEQLKKLWGAVDGQRYTEEQYEAEKESLLDRYRQEWSEALLMDGHNNLKESLVAELCSYLGTKDLAEGERRCAAASDELEKEWAETVIPGSTQSIEALYNDSKTILYELMWWHTLLEDDAPLAYVIAVDLARKLECRSYLDFGAGVGSGGLLFARQGFHVTLADISSRLLVFSRWRFDQRGLPVRIVDLKEQDLRRHSFDFVTAMDVFEHLVDPVGTVDMLADALRPGGVIFGRFDVDEDDDRGQHIVHDFEPCFARMRELGFVRIWEDDWLWGHLAFQKGGDISAYAG